jgi:hypothetical protein
MKAECGIASLLAISEWSNKIMNELYVHDIILVRWSSNISKGTLIKCNI